MKESHSKSVPETIEETESENDFSDDEIQEEKKVKVCHFLFFSR
jgi:hypothetical protein